MVLEERRENALFTFIYRISAFILTPARPAGNMPVPIGQLNGRVRVIDKA